MIIGGLVNDITSKINPTSEKQYLRDSFPGVITSSLGGVARNMAEACFRSGGDPKFVSTIGNDVSLLNELEKIGMDTDGISRVKHVGTATYNAILDPNGYHFFRTN